MLNVPGKYSSLLLGVVIVFSLSGCITTGGSAGEVIVRDGDTRIAVSFNDRDRELINTYYKKRIKRMPPGLAKKNKLPPGLQKQVERNGRLPPGLQGRALPYDLEKDLSYLPDGYVRLRVGTDLVIMNSTTRVILDVIRDIL